MRRLPLLYSYCKRQRASAIIGALVLTAVLALAVGAMLSTTNTAIRRSADKIAYEEAYQTTLAATHAARAWLIDPDLYDSMVAAGTVKAVAMPAPKTAGLSLAQFPSPEIAAAVATNADLRSVIKNATDMNREIQKKVKEAAQKNQTIPTFEYGDIDTYFTKYNIPRGKTLKDGRQIVITFPVKPISLVNNTKKFSDKLFFSTPAGGDKNYVKFIRLTTTGNTPKTKASLRECTFIVEAVGVSEYADVVKERSLHQRVLLKPNEPGNPLLSATEAIITDGSFSAKEMSSGNVHWGPVLARENIVNPFFNAITKRYTGSGKNTQWAGWEFTLNQQQKANLAGLPVADSGNNSSFNSVLDKWVAWKTGDGKLYAGQKGTDYMFQDMPGVPENAEFDFFKSLMSGSLNIGQTPVNSTNFQLDPKFTNAGTSLANASSFNGLVQYENGQYTSGALVQKSPAVKERINDFFGTYNYEKLKAYAQSHNAYFKYDSNTNTLYDAANNKVTLPSMTPGNTDTLSADASPDRMLFIDSMTGTESSPFKDAIQLPSFWKGIVYANGPIATSGAGSSPNIMMRSPDQFTAYRQDGTTQGGVGNGIFVDGIVICNGTADLGANGAIYGTLAAKKGVITGANFSVFYNAANAEGRLRDISKSAEPYALIAGKLYETEIPEDVQ